MKDEKNNNNFQSSFPEWDFEAEINEMYETAEKQKWLKEFNRINSIDESFIKNKIACIKEFLVLVSDNYYFAAWLEYRNLVFSELTCERIQKQFHNDCDELTRNTFIKLCDFAGEDWKKYKIILPSKSYILKYRYYNKDPFDFYDDDEHILTQVDLGNFLIKIAKDYAKAYYPSIEKIIEILIEKNLVSEESQKEWEEVIENEWWLSECSVCGCKFKHKWDDTYITYVKYSEYGNRFKHRCIRCPNCGNEVTCFVYD